LLGRTVRSRETALTNQSGLKLDGSGHFSRASADAGNPAGNATRAGGRVRLLHWPACFAADGAKRLGIL